MPRRPATRPPRVDRLDLLARVLRDRPGLSAGDLAEELGVSIRSVFRDIDLLRERGYPIEASRGRGGGLRLHPNWGLGRVLLSRDEALCTLLGLAVAEKLGFPMFAGDVGRARRKIADAFPASERRRIAPLRERIFTGGPASATVRASWGSPAPVPMRHLQVAFVEQRIVRADYAKEDGTILTRRLEPHALVINAPAWYLVAYDYLRGGQRTFRLDRFAAVDLEEATFQPRPREVVAELLASPDVRMDQV